MACLAVYIQQIFEQYGLPQPDVSRTADYFSSDLLILDDLGTEFSTQLSVSVVYNIINTRLLKGLSTVISTNLDLKEISETYNDRIASRIVGSYTICPFFGNDIRQIKSVNRI